MFKMSPFGFHRSKKTLSPLQAYGCVDDALVDSFPDSSNAFTQFVVFQKNQALAFLSQHRRMLVVYAKNL